jgi:hypothetical protein
LFSEAACPAKHANRQHPWPTVMGRSPVRDALPRSLWKTWNVAKLTSKISSSRRTISWLTAALLVIVSNAGAVAAMDASLASVSDNPAAPKAGIVLLRCFLFDARFTGQPAVTPLTSVCLAIVSACASPRNVPAPTRSGKYKKPLWRPLMASVARLESSGCRGPDIGSGDGSDYSGVDAEVTPSAAAPSTRK